MRVRRPPQPPPAEVGVWYCRTCGRFGLAGRRGKGTHFAAPVPGETGRYCQGRPVVLRYALDKAQFLADEQVLEPQAPSTAPGAPEGSR